MNQLAIKRTNAIDIPTYISCLGVDVPKLLNNFGRVTGSSSDWGYTDRLVIEVYKSAEQVVPIDSETQELHEEVIEVRNISIDQIKEEMLLLQADGETRYADEIAEMLKLDVIDVIDAFNLLQEEGKLFIDNDKL